MPPFLEVHAVVDARRDARVVEGEQGVFVDQHILAARLVFEFFDLGDQLAVVFEERRTGQKFARRQRAADKYLACLGRG